jgi:hypothetical protein
MRVSVDCQPLVGIGAIEIGEEFRNVQIDDLCTLGAHPIFSFLLDSFSAGASIRPRQSVDVGLP